MRAGVLLDTGDKGRWDIKIAIAGKAGSGKSTAAKWLVGNYGFEQRALATPLKGLCGLHSLTLEMGPDYTLRQDLEDLLPFSTDHTIDELLWQIEGAFKAVPVTEGKNRTLLQVVGTNILRHHDPNIWVNYLIRMVAEDKDDHTVVDDVRFVNEFDALRAKGWHMVFCYCPSAVREARLEHDYGRPLTEEERNHPSELELDSIPLSSWDWVLNTAGSIKSERTQVDEMMAYLTGVEADVAAIPAGA